MPHQNKKGKSKKNNKRKKRLKDTMNQASDNDSKSLKPWNTFWVL